MRLPRYEERKAIKWRRYLVKRQHGKCAYCRRAMVEGHPKMKPTFDHVHALSRGGRHHLENGKAACAECNQKKGAMSDYCPALT